MADVIVTSVVIEPAPAIQVATNVQGPPGPQGPQGEQGPPGPSGPGMETYTHSQVASSSSWLIVHNLQRHPHLFIEDSAGQVVYGEVTHVDDNNVRIDFSAPFSGVARLM